ncbi:MAG: glutamate-5-semialdehyde dehydrogenase [Candidatus Tectomicrobia bacterium]|uniref:Gamma-glutamyl phosphate reductase n=1 Tax=Tectimicrobiota bacterium TaxID=2528274 RepID=A0A933GN63_UNCTE|nr:glutamate-5-semialdehyde dehydrogenase [Candidatus Tectomicrobia bacterium]
MKIDSFLLRKAQGAKESSRKLSCLSSDFKNKALLAMADLLEEDKNQILQANQEDLIQAKEKGLSPALIDRLRLDPIRIKSMADGLREVAALPDPIGDVVKMWLRPNGLQVGKMRVPIGVIAIIYESRPNVTADAAGLCLKAGNSVILRGGSEAINSNQAIFSILSSAAYKHGIPEGALQFIETTDRSAIYELLKMDKFIDLVIPRGGEGLIRTVVENSTIPVIKHDKGVCHTYIDEESDLEMGRKIAFNAKVQRPGVCNAMETLLVHERVAERFLPVIVADLEAAGVEIRGCPQVKAYIPHVNAATEDDWYSEYLDLILAIKVVKNMDEAMDHIAKYGSAHSEAIVTNNYTKAMRFLREVDSAAVFVNASTRFTDGNQFGLGAELGISTQKLHARGPMGLEELTSIKFIVFGQGQIRE